MVQIKGQYLLSDVLIMHKLHRKRDWMWTWLIYIWIGIMVVSSIGGLLAADSIDSAGQALILLVIPGTLAFIQYVSIPKQIARNFKQQKEYMVPFEMDFTEEGVQMRNEFLSYRKPWADFIKWKENDELLLLYQSDTSTSIIPKRLFQNRQDMDYVYEKIEQHHIPDASQGKPSVGRQAVIFFSGLFLLMLLLHVLTRGLF